MLSIEETGCDELQEIWLFQYFGSLKYVERSTVSPSKNNICLNCLTDDSILHAGIFSHLQRSGWLIFVSQPQAW